MQRYLKLTKKNYCVVYFKPARSHALGMGLPLMAFFHLVAHAYFKAILFISAGGFIHRIKEFQDLRAMGAAVFYIPVSVRIFLVANLSLCGIPFMSGFISKDLI